jgi:hypothetical protein
MHAWGIQGNPRRTYARIQSQTDIFTASSISKETHRSIHQQRRFDQYLRTPVLIGLGAAREPSIIAGSQAHVRTHTIIGRHQHKIRVYTFAATLNVELDLGPICKKADNTTRDRTCVCSTYVYEHIYVTSHTMYLRCTSFRLVGRWYFEHAYWQPSADQFVTTLDFPLIHITYH